MEKNWRSSAGTTSAAGHGHCPRRSGSKRVELVTLLPKHHGRRRTWRKLPICRHLMEVYHAHRWKSPMTLFMPCYSALRASEARDDPRPSGANRGPEGSDARFSVWTRESSTCPCSSTGSTSSWDWAPIWETLNDDRLLALDLLGFGFATNPTPPHLQHHGAGDLCEALGRPPARAVSRLAPTTATSGWPGRTKGMARAH